MKDPLCEYHYDLTPYHYVMNNPIKFIDPLGLDTTYYVPPIEPVTVVVARIVPEHLDEKRENDNAGSAAAKALYDKDGGAVTEINHNHPKNSLPSGYDRVTGDIKPPNAVGNYSGDAKAEVKYPTNSRQPIKRGVYRSAFKSINRYDEKKVYSSETY